MGNCFLKSCTDSPNTPEHKYAWNISFLNIPEVLYYRALIPVPLLWRYTDNTCLDLHFSMPQRITFAVALKIPQRTSSRNSDAESTFPLSEWTTQLEITIWTNKCWVVGITVNWSYPERCADAVVVSKHWVLSIRIDDERQHIPVDLDHCVMLVLLVFSLQLKVTFWFLNLGTTVSNPKI